MLSAHSFASLENCLIITPWLLQGSHARRHARDDGGVPPALACGARVDARLAAAPRCVPMPLLVCLLAVSDAGRLASRDFSKWRAEKLRIEQSALIRKKRGREGAAAR